MHITAVSFANFSGTNKVNNSFTKQNSSENINSQKHSAYELPGYNVSFGTRIIKYDKNPGVMLSIEEREQLDNEIQDIIKYEDSTGTEIKEQMQQMFEKYHNKKAAMQYILVRGINKMTTGEKNANKYEPYPDYIKAYLHTINSYFKDSPSKRKEYLRMALFTKNLDGNTLAHAALKPTSAQSNGILKAIFDETDKYPAIQVEILQDKRRIERGGKVYTETIGKRVANCAFTQLEDGKIINNVLQKLCANTTAISRQKSIDLLKANERMLNRQNKEILEALQSKDCICTDKEFGKPEPEAETKQNIAAQGTNSTETKPKNTGNVQEKRKAKQIEVPPFFDNNDNAGTISKQTADVRQQNPKQEEMVIPDFLKNYGKKNKTGAKQAKNNPAAQNGAKPANMRTQTGDTEPKQWDKELKVGDFFRPSKNGSAIQATFMVSGIGAEDPDEQPDALEDIETADTTAEIKDFNQLAARQSADPYINWEQMACDG